MLVLLALVQLTLAADPAPFQVVLDQHLDAQGQVDYAAIRAKKALDPYLQALSTTAEPADRAGRMAFWLNAYNALTVDLIADAWPVGSIRDLDGGRVWNTRRFTVAGRSVTLDEIEHRILRPMNDPRVHAAINCASRGCPPLPGQVFKAAELDRQLDAASRRWARSNGLRIDRATKKVELSKIFDWYGEDFLARTDADIPGADGKKEAAIDFLADHLPEEDARWLRAGGYEIGWQDYDWGVNAR